MRASFFRAFLPKQRRGSGDTSGWGDPQGVGRLPLGRRLVNPGLTWPSLDSLEPLHSQGLFREYHESITPRKLRATLAQCFEALGGAARGL